MIPFSIPFIKAHACGNDFLILDEAVAGRAHAGLARRLCARNTSIGADGIEFLDRDPARRAGGDCFLRLFNADGSEAELSGNGTRCVAAWLAHSEGLREVALGTQGGVRSCRVIEASDPVYLIESEMGVPQVVARTIELPGVGAVAGAMAFTMLEVSADSADLNRRIKRLIAFVCGGLRAPSAAAEEKVEVTR